MLCFIIDTKIETRLAPVRMIYLPLHCRILQLIPPDQVEHNTGGSGKWLPIIPR